MELLIFIPLLMIIILLWTDNIKLRKSNAIITSKKDSPLPDIMGKTKALPGNVKPQNTFVSQNKKKEQITDNLDSEIQQQGSVDLEAEESEWQPIGDQYGDDVLTEGVTQQELVTAKNLLQQEVLDEQSQEQAVKIVRKIQGTELFSLLENSMEGMSHRIAALLDKQTSGSNISEAKDSNDFDIREFV